MREKTKTLCAAIVCLTVGSCASQNHESPASMTPVDTSHEGAPLTSVLGQVASSGQCDPSVIDIDHGKFTATVIYHGFSGQPNRQVTLRYIDLSGHEIGRGGFTSGEHPSNLTLELGIANEDLQRIDVEAQTPSGRSLGCFIPVS